MKKTICMIALGVAVGNFASAQTVTVAKSGSPDHATIQAAIDSFSPDPDGGLANVIQITDDALYDEAITIDVPVTIEGTGLNRPVIAAQTSAAADGNDGVTIHIPNDATSKTITLRNLIIIPSQTNTPADDLLRVTGSGTPLAATENLDLILEDLLVTANDGSDGPLVTDGVTDASLTGAIQTGDDSAFISGANTSCTLTNVIFTHSSGDGLVCSSLTTGYTVNGASAFSYHGRLGIQVNQNFDINGLDNDRVMVVGNLGFAGIWGAGDGTQARTWNNVNVLNTAVGGSNGWGIEHQNGGDFPLTLTNAIIAGNNAQGFLVGGVGTAGQITMSDVTIANNGGNPIEVNSASAAPIDIADSIIAGGPAGGGETILHEGTGTMTISNSALVTAGSIALQAPGYSGAGTVNVSGIINDNPIFINIIDPTSADFYDVDNPAYAAAATGGANLSGGADFIGSFVVLTNADHWNLYR